ncbi:hypothetical protein, partial [Paraburkholderia tropica]
MGGKQFGAPVWRPIGSGGGIIFRHPLRLASVGAKIRPLRCTQQATRRSEACDETSGFAGSTSFLSGNVKKDVDETKKRLHNLVSLLLTQQRSKRRVVTAHYGA